MRKHLRLARKIPLLGIGSKLRKRWDEPIKDTSRFKKCPYLLKNKFLT